MPAWGPLNTAMAVMTAVVLAAASPLPPPPHVAVASAAGVASPASTARAATPRPPASADRTAPPPGASAATAPPPERAPAGVGAVLATARTAVTRSAPLGPSLSGVFILALAGFLLVRRVRRMRHPDEG